MKLSVRSLRKFLPEEIPHKNLAREITRNKTLRQEIDRRIEEKTKSKLFSRHPILEHTKESLILRGDLLVNHPALYKQNAWRVIEACLEIGVYPQLGIWQIR